MATMKDVAEQAGVSVATVSRVLNHQGPINAETQKAVEDAIRALDYEPNLTARNLRKSESKIILVIAPNITNPYYMHILAGIGEEAQRCGFSAFNCNTMGDKDEAARQLQLLARKRADGAILFSVGVQGEMVAEYARQYPLVLCSEYNPDVLVERVSIDNHSAAYEATQFLLSLGHRRIGTISSQNDFISTKLRLEGYRAALRDAGIEPDERYVGYASVDYSFASGQRCARGLLSLEKRPTALFCISDMLALGAISSAQAMGFAVPKDVTVIGFDDVESTTMFHPYVTTVAQPCKELGVQAMKLLYRRITEKQIPDAEKVVVLPHKIIQRESAGPAVDRMDFADCFAGAPGLPLES